MLTAREVADYFLATWPDDAGEGISNLKLQKLCYYAEGFHLALFGEPLFSEYISAWEHGPVVPDLYHAFKHHGAGPIPRPADIDFEKYSQDVKDLLDEIVEVYGQFSAWKLRNMTHAEPPWIKARASGASKIQPDHMREYFKTLVL